MNRRKTAALYEAFLRGDLPEHSKLTSILDSIGESFSIIDREFRVLFMNHVAEAGLKDVNLTRDDIIGKVVWDVLPDLVGTKAWRASTRALETNEPQQYLLHYEPLDRWSEGRIYPSPEGLSSFSRDVTAQKQFEQAVLSGATSSSPCPGGWRSRSGGRAKKSWIATWRMPKCTAMTSRTM